MELGLNPQWPVTFTTCPVLTTCARLLQSPKLFDFICQPVVLPNQCNLMAQHVTQINF